MKTLYKFLYKITEMVPMFRNKIASKYIESLEFYIEKLFKLSLSFQHRIEEIDEEIMEIKKEIVEIKNETDL